MLTEPSAMHLTWRKVSAKRAQSVHFDAGHAVCDVWQPCCTQAAPTQRC